MTFKRLLGIAMSLCALAVLVGSVGAGATRTPAKRAIDLSTKEAVIHYLRSIHLSAKGVVIQRGLRNYAGAHCPGKGWTCAGTRHTVVQIAKPGGLNRFACRTAKCAVVQFGGASRRLRRFAASNASQSKPPPPPPNTALCVKTTGVTQSCVINQPNASGTNRAVVWMVTPKLTGLTQSTVYTASIKQGPASATGSSNTNLACVRQFVWIDGSTTKTNGTSTTVTNNNHESISIQQNSLTGTNTVEGAKPSGATYDCDTSSGSQLQQDEQLTSVVTTKGSITQNQNTATTGSANVVLDIEQNQDINGFSGFFGNASGQNNAAFEQSTNQVAIANTPNGTVTQTQGANVPDPPFSGLVGTINQDSSAKSTASATQTETQCEDAVNMTVPAPPSGTPPQCPVVGDTGVPPGVTLTQTQYGPEGVFTPPTRSAGRVPLFHKGYGQSQLTGNPGCNGGCDKFTLIQHSTQNNDKTPDNNVLGTQSNIIQGDCTSIGGSCDARQTATLNGQDTKDGYTAGTISQLKINCDNGHSSCQPTPPPAPTLTGHPTDGTNSTSATFEFTDPATSANFICKLDGTVNPAGNCGTPTVINGLADGTQTYTGLSYGTHTFQVAAVDAYGNPSAYIPDPAFSWTIVPPTPVIDTSPPNPSSSSSATFTFTDADSTLTLECQIDNSGYSVCTSPWTYSNLADGSHTFFVKATDGAGHESAVESFTWTISGGGASANTIDQLNPLSDPVGGLCTDWFASGGGFDGTPAKVTVSDTTNLAAYDGQAIQLRFSFNTKDFSYNAFQGWYLNNIQVTGMQSGNPVTVFSDAVAAGDTSFTALGDHGVAPGWHVTDSNATMGPAWWYGNDDTGTYQTPGSSDPCNDPGPNAGTITTPVFTLASSSQLSFDTLWQIEGVNPSNFDLMDVQVIPVTSTAG